MASDWRLLPLSGPTAAELPLLFRGDFSATGYTVYISDLTHVWSEKLDRRGIIRRALDEDTSVDPSEGAEQFKLLLDKISDSLSGRENTYLDLVPSRDNDFILRVFTYLPVPLEPLKWDMRLSMAAAPSLKDALVLPLLAGAAAQRRQVDDLLRILRDKDHVIGNLMDRLGSSEKEITKVFPSAVGLDARHTGSLRDKAGTYVKGLGVFDVEDWRKRVRKNEPKHENIADVIQDALEGLSLPSTIKLDRRAKDEKSDVEWWKQLGTKDVTSRRDNPAPSEIIKGSVTQKSGSPPLASNENGSDGEFQRQNTPPHPSFPGGIPSNDSSPSSAGFGRRSNATKYSKNDTETSLNDDQDRSDNSNRSHANLKASRTQSPVQRPRSMKVNNEDDGRHRDSSSSLVPQKRLGLIGGVEKSAKDAGLPSSSRHDGGQLSVSDSSNSGADLRSGSDFRGSSKYQFRQPRTGPFQEGADVTPDDPRQQSKGAEKSESLLQKPKSKLGIIGGKKKAPSTLEERPHESVQRQDGTVGSHTNQSLNGNDGKSLTGKSNGKALSGQNPEEAEERADRRREELKRQLEEKSKTPQKKKRRF
ncbi:MAG: hypothetical protein M1833_002176 [Piccolia ochrophora]|nr:MAG: hypothetical protein M1833_002176 [Piccolia ochrophora]